MPKCQKPKCNHEWKARNPINEITNCPKCRTKYWNKPRKIKTLPDNVLEKPNFVKLIIAFIRLQFPYIEETKITERNLLKETKLRFPKIKQKTLAELSGIKHQNTISNLLTALRQHNYLINIKYRAIKNGKEFTKVGEVINKDKFAEELFRHIKKQHKDKYVKSRKYVNLLKKDSELDTYRIKKAEKYKFPEINFKAIQDIIAKDFFSFLVKEYYRAEIERNFLEMFEDYGKYYCSNMESLYINFIKKKKITYKLKNIEVRGLRMKKAVFREFKWNKNKKNALALYQIFKEALFDYPLPSVPNPNITEGFGNTSSPYRS